LKTVFLIIALCLALVLLAPLVMRDLFFRLPVYSAEFDCDDAAVLMMERLDGVGITGTPILGNLKMAGEKYLESDHIWLLADIAGRQVAFDKGVFCLDSQHYEGFPLSKQQLQEFVEQDYRLARAGGPAGP